jgi:hypothetical protein
MPTPGRVLGIGDVALRALASGREGEVVAVFSRAAYLDLAGDIAVLVLGDVPNGPLHVRLDRLPRLRRGARVRCRSGVVAIEEHRWLTPSAAWRPEPPVDVVSAEPIVSAVVRHRPVLDMGTGSVVDIDGWLVPLLAHGDVAGACARLFGRGAGLTPAGDDVAAGILLVECLSGSADRTSLGLLATRAPTHAISRAFLRAAAENQCIEPVHTLLRAASAGDEGVATDAVEQLSRVGHTSGLDLAAGVRAALVALAARADSADRTPRDTISIHAHKVP